MAGSGSGVVVLGAVVLIGVVAVVSILYSEWVVLALSLAALVGFTVAVGNWVMRGFPDLASRRAVRHAFYVALVIRVVAALVLYAGLILAAWQGRPGIFFDDEVYYTTLPVLTGMTSWGAVWEASLERSPHSLYLLYIGSIFRLFGDSNLVVRLVSGILASLLVPVTARIALHMRGRDSGTRGAVLAAWIIALSPELLLFSVSVMRDWMLALVVATTFLLILELLLRWHRLSLIGGLVLCMTALFFLRVATGLLIPMIMASCAVLEGMRRHGRPLRVARAVVLPFLVLFGLLAVAAQMGFTPLSPLSPEQWVAYVSGRYFFSEHIANRLETASTLSRTFLESSTELLGSPALGLLLVSAKRLVSPTPLWFLIVGEINAVVYFLPGLFWYALLPGAIVGGVSMLRSLTLPRLLLLVAVVLLFGYSFTPPGLAVEPLRARVQAFPLLYVTAAMGFLVLQERPRLRKTVVLAAVVMYMAISLFYYLGLILPWPALHPYSLAVMALFGLLLFGVALVSREGLGRLLARGGMR